MPSAVCWRARASRSPSVPPPRPGYSHALRLPSTATATTTNGSAASGSATDTVLAPNLTISKVGDPAIVNATDPVHFTITVGNTGAGTAYNVNLSDPLPASANLNWTIQAGDAGTISGGTLSDAIGSLASGASVTIHVSAVTPAGYIATLNNTATASSSNNQPGERRRSATDTVAPLADLAITIVGSRYTPVTPLTYTVTVTNNGPTNAVGASVADMIPAALTGVTWTSSTTGSASVSSGSSGSGDSLTAMVNIPAGPGNSVVFVETGLAPCWCSAPAELDNTATVTPPSGLTDPNMANNSATDSETLYVGQNPITVNSAGDDPSGPSAGTVTLRDAINAVDAGTADSIHFNIPTTDPGYDGTTEVWTITLAADLPALDKPVFIDGSTQPGGAVEVNGNNSSMLDDNTIVNPQGRAVHRRHGDCGKRRHLERVVHFRCGRLEYREQLRQRGRVRQFPRRRFHHRVRLRHRPLPR